MSGFALFVLGLLIINILYYASISDKAARDNERKIEEAEQAKQTNKIKRKQVNRIMYEEAINQLELMGIPYVENEDGTVVIDVAEQDGTTVVEIIGFLNDNMIDYVIEGSEIIVTAIEDIEEEGLGTEDEDAMALAEEDLMGMF